MIQSNLEPDPRRVPRHRGCRVRGKSHISERVDILLRRPLLSGTDLVLKTLGEVRPRRFVPGKRHLIVHIEDRLLGLVRGQGGFAGRLPGGLVASSRVSGQRRGGSLRDVLPWFNDPLEEPGPLLSNVRAEQRPRARGGQGQQEQREQKGGERHPLPRTRPEGSRREADRALGRTGEVWHSSPAQAPLDAPTAYGDRKSVV